jgi:hypothetical protein
MTIKYSHITASKSKKHDLAKVSLSALNLNLNHASSKSPTTVAIFCKSQPELFIKHQMNFDYQD